jgi:hypothetical protein
MVVTNANKVYRRHEVAVLDLLDPQIVSTRVRVQNVPEHVTEDLLMELFSQVSHTMYYQLCRRSCPPVLSQFFVCTKFIPN